MQEKYQIFLESREGLISGALQFDQSGDQTTGQMELYGFPLTLTDVRVDGNKRSFNGQLNLQDHLLDFMAEGELEDDVLDVMVRAAGKKMLLTGFLKK